MSFIKFMHTNTALGIVLLALLMECLVAMIVTAANKDILEKYKVEQYGRALQALTEQRPFAGRVLTSCYLLAFLQLIVWTIASYL